MGCFIIRLIYAMQQLLKSMIRRPHLRALLTYIAVSLIILLGARVLPSESALSEAVPVLLSILLLVPLCIWYKTYASKKSLSKEVNGRAKSAVLLWIFVLFIGAMAVRIPSVLLFGRPYEKTPLIYLLILTIAVTEKTDVSVFGFESEKIGVSLLKGAILYVVLGGSALAIESLLVHVFTGQAIMRSFDAVSILFAMPFQTLCVGISEEGFFRGYVQTHLEKILTFRRALLGQALLFGVWHFVWSLSPFDPLSMVIYIATSCMWGLAVGYFYGKFRSLVPVVFTHGLWNSVISGMMTNEAAYSALGGMPFLNQISVALLPSLASGMLTTLFIKCLSTKS